jgi:ribosomal protein S18 acetylase RimI-like enzyme
VSEVRIVDLRGVPDPAAVGREAHRLLADLVAGGAALGWVDPPDREEIDRLIADLISASTLETAAIRGAFIGEHLVGLGYWRRYARPTHRTNANLERIAVSRDAQGRGVGRALLAALVEQARTCRIETLTLDVRGDNDVAVALYVSAGFVQYGRLRNFVSVGPARYDKVFMALEVSAPPSCGTHRGCPGEFDPVEPPNNP